MKRPPAPVSSAAWLCALSSVSCLLYGLLLARGNMRAMLGAAIAFAFPVLYMEIDRWRGSGDA